ncbi:hypothetical protein CBA19CS91_39940 [Paraburkholderia hospita]|nr:hypothetical protein CBA19CS91_39940 [Paraburkholderia hospita]
MNYDAAAAKLRVEVALIRAVAEVESSGSGFLDSHRPKILFERHCFYRALKAKGMDADGFAKHMPDICNPVSGGYEGGAHEYDRLELAASIDHAAAYESASWGAFQIMGYHWRALGYTSIDDYVQEMHESEEAQLDAFVRFVLVTPSLVKALRAKDFASFAAGYNGPAYRKFSYDSKMASAYGKYK